MRIAIVNDMAMAVEALRRVLLQTKEHDLAWVARDGAEAVDCCAKDTPDLILMDLYMPNMDGVEATRRIMASTPCAIVVVTASVSQNSSKVFEAMGLGALDAVNTPTLDATGTVDGNRALVAKIETIRRLIGTSGRKHPADQPAATPVPPLLAIGASAGGPAALAAVISRLPADFPGAVVIIQHVDVQFAENLAEWLNEQSGLTVRIAREGDRPEPGTVLLAATNHHLAFISPGRLGYTVQPAAAPYRPSVDVFFDSIRRFWQGEVVAVLLTGMGRDGARGLKALREAGHHTVAQDRATCAVYGMPKAAAELDAASDILPVDQIAPRLVTLFNRNH